MAPSPSATCQLLWDAAHQLFELTPGVYLVTGSRGKNTAAVSPWSYFFNPDHSDDISAKHRVGGMGIPIANLPIHAARAGAQPPDEQLSVFSLVRLEGS
jgi:hypothetical protein